jgi:hypothetical protein
MFRKFQCFGHRKSQSVSLRMNHDLIQTVHALIWQFASCHVLRGREVYYKFQDCINTCAALYIDITLFNTSFALRYE